jgi:hypothetical protein
MTHDLALRSLHSLREALDQLRRRRMPVPAFCQVWRAQTALLAALPPRYGAVAEDLLGRLEAGSLFTEESCSFSQEDLLANFAAWLDKASQTLSSK